MRAKQLIEELIALEEAVNIDRGNVAVEMEMLIRADIKDTKKLNELFFNLGMQHQPDGSIERNPWTRDAYYRPIEVTGEMPLRWSELKPKLLALLSWLKQSDEVFISRAAAETGSTLLSKEAARAMHLRYGAFDQSKWKLVAMPRAKNPVNQSTGLHLHFDVAQWFSGVQHAETFVKMFNRTGEHFFRPAVHPSRYDDNRPGHRGHGYAAWNALNEPTYSSGHVDNPKSVRLYFSAAHHSRLSAMNCMSVLKKDRGDVEFRFPHATLNLNTIEGWLFAIAEMIEFSRKYHIPGEKPIDPKSDFQSYLDQEAPDTATFLRNRAEKMRKAKPEPPFPGYDPQVDDTPVPEPHRQGRALKRHIRRVGHPGVPLSVQ